MEGWPLISLILPPPLQMMIILGVICAIILIIIIGEWGRGGLGPSLDRLSLWSVGLKVISLVCTHQQKT